MTTRILTAALALVIAIAAQAQDFATKYMSENAGDTTLNCISVSPKMMEEIIQRGIQENDTIGIAADIISKLKSMQIVNTDKQASLHFDKAEKMAQRNSARFKVMGAYNNSKERDDRCRIFVRKQREHIVELVLLKQKGTKFMVINFTGNMNKEFIDKLSHTMLPHHAEKDNE